MTDPVKAHVTYTGGPLKDEHAPLGGESFWATPNDDGTFTVDNVLFGSDNIGYLDTFRAEWDGVWWEVTEVVDRHECWRGVIVFSGPRKAAQFRKAAKDLELHTEGWAGDPNSPVTFQCSTSDWTALRKILNTHPAVEAFSATYVN